MIFLPSTPPDADRHALADHLHAELFPSPPRAASCATWTDEVAAALATVWADVFDRAALPSRLYSLMAARACWHVGERSAAERLLRTSCAAKETECNALRDLFERGGPSLGLCRLLSTDAVRAAQTSVPPGQTLWILDLDKLHVHAPLEVVLLPRVRAAVESLGEVWDADAGSGALGLCSSRRRCVPVAETVRYCRDLLDRVRRERGWRNRPDLRWVGAGNFSRARR